MKETHLEITLQMQLQQSSPPILTYAIPLLFLVAARIPQSCLARLLKN